MATLGGRAAAAAAEEEEEDGREGSGDGELQNPCGLALLRCGRELFVADYRNNRVVVLAVADGSVVRSWAVAGEAGGLCIGPDGRLFVTSRGVWGTVVKNRDSGRLRKFS